MDWLLSRWCSCRERAVNPTLSNVHGILSNFSHKICTIPAQRQLGLYIGLILYMYAHYSRQGCYEFASSCLFVGWLVCHQDYSEMIDDFTTHECGLVICLVASLSVCLSCSPFLYTSWAPWASCLAPVINANCQENGDVT